MARSTSTNTSNKTVAVIEETAVDKVLAAAASKLLVLAPAWLIAILGVGVAEAFHRIWHGSTWAAAGIVPPTLLLTALSWAFSHHRAWLGRMHVTATTGCCGVWLAYAVAYGPFSGPLMDYATLVGGTTVALSWNIRHVIREIGDGRGHDTLRTLFGEEQAETVGLAGARIHTIKQGAHKILAKLHMVPGEKVADDAIKKAPYVEAVLELPPGSVTVTTDIDRADHANVTVSDPRVMRNPIAWPGPSNPGASIADPIRPGVWQDLDPVEYVIVGHHVQVMGMTGSGKSIGCAWDALAEIVTRRDVMVLAIDLVKGRQTLGPLEAALHRFETTIGGARELLAELAGKLQPRTDYLAGKSLVGWEEGCGLTYCILWVEEAWRLFDKINMDDFEDLMKAFRSAGGTIVYSLQRSDHSQVPTLIRGQSAYWCFGVAQSKDATFGLSEPQRDGEARPELWANRQPGMAYLDAPTIPEERICLPMRTYSWDKNAEALRAHAAQYPAADKHVDAITASLVKLRGAETPLGRPSGEDREATSAGNDDDMTAHRQFRVPDPDPELTASLGADDPIDDQPGDESFTFTRRADEKMPADQARGELLDQLADWAETGRSTFATRDLRPVWERTGYSRPWIIAEVKRLISEGVIDDHDDGGYVILRAPERV